MLVSGIPGQLNDSCGEWPVYARGVCTPPTDTEMALREFKDANDVEWRAWDVQPTSAFSRENFADGWLTFESTVGRRRLRTYPADWHSLPDEALRELCGKASVVGPRKRLIE